MKNMSTIDPKDAMPGDEVFVIFNNPHTPVVSNIKPAEIVQHPKDPNKIALFLDETLYVIEDDDALFTSEAAAESAYNTLFDSYE